MCILFLLSACGCADPFDNVSIRDLEAGEVVARHIPYEARLILVLPPCDAHPELTEDGMTPRYQLAHRLLASGRFRILLCDSPEEADALALTHAGLPQSPPGPLVFRWALTDRRVQTRSIENEINFDALVFLAGVATLLTGSDEDKPVHQLAGMAIMENADGSYNSVTHARHVRIKMTGQAFSAETGEVLASATGELNDYISELSPGKSSEFSLLGGGSYHSESNDVQIATNGRLMNIASQRIADDLIAWADAWYDRSQLD